MTSPRSGRTGRFVLALVLAIAVAALSTWGLGLLWTLIGGGEMSLHGWIAMAIGVLGTVGLAWVLMALAFRSDREGWDDRVDNSLDPGQGPPPDKRE